jgi:hypothetical protein
MRLGLMGVGLPLGFYTAVRRSIGRITRAASSAAGDLCRAWSSRRCWLCFRNQMAFAARGALGIAVARRLADDCVGLFSPADRAPDAEGMFNVMSAEFHGGAGQRLGENALMLKHAFRLAVLPVVSFSGLLADLLTGSFVIENISNPRRRSLFVNSMASRDYTMTVGLVLLTPSC